MTTHDVAQDDNRFRTAILQGDMTTLRTMINYLHYSGAQKADNRGKTPLVIAVELGFVPVIQFLIVECNCSIRDKDPKTGNTLLQIALYNEHNDAARALLQMRCDPHIVNKNGASFLFTACWFPDYLLVQTLLNDYNFSVDIRTHHGQTPLMVLCAVWGWRRGPGKKRTLEVLLNHNCNVNLVDEYGFTALHYAVLENIGGSNVSLVKTLITQHACDRNAKTTAVSPEFSAVGVGSTVLCMAASNGDAGMVRVLLDFGFDPFIQDDRGGDALSYSRGACKALIQSHINRCALPMGLHSRLGARSPLFVLDENVLRMISEMSLLDDF